ncbi:TPA: ATP-binding protein [Streptococcus suis]|nr:ATP-binding protein [Streptococcus suis]NQL78691.1 ATP-binding protein [Streptococcus suis]HEL2461035.1 ATP-binding protein [Streptococcus suis]HEM2772353.1 ATP-binding protein [Streptococcus suis]HEM4281143.1 ATP-binding protein [Streptococcus suis]
MLIEFKVKNFTSFKNEVTFSMVSSEKLTEHLDNRIEIEENLHLLKIASIFGANASGKSNLLQALMFMFAFIKNSMQDSKEGKRKFNNLTFSLDTVSKDAPTEFEISFIMKNQIVTYGFSLEKGEVKSEKLFVDDQLVFERGINGIESYSIEVFKKKEELDLKFSLTNSYSLFLTVLSVTNTELAESIMEYFTQNINFLSGYGHNARFTKSLIRDNNSYKSKIIDLLKIADFNITDLEVRQHKYEVKLVGEAEEEIPEEILEEAKENANRLLSKHNIYDSEGKIIDSKLFDADLFESTGTKVFLSMVGHIVSVLENGGVLIIDEADALLHPLVTKYLMRLFNNSENKNSQLIITSHNSNILDQELLRRDQIWFVEKDEFEVSHLTSLSEYRFNGAVVRSDERYAKNYLKGKYGAIPFIKNDVVHTLFKGSKMED